MCQVHFKFLNYAQNHEKQKQQKTKQINEQQIIYIKYDEKYRLKRSRIQVHSFLLISNDRATEELDILAFRVESVQQSKAYFSR